MIPRTESSSFPPKEVNLTPFLKPSQQHHAMP
jgi:hypothetical protein